MSQKRNLTPYGSMLNFFPPPLFFYGRRQLHFFIVCCINFSPQFFTVFLQTCSINMELLFHVKTKENYIFISVFLYTHSVSDFYQKYLLQPWQPKQITWMSLDSISVHFLKSSTRICKMFLSNQCNMEVGIACSQVCYQCFGHGKDYKFHHYKHHC